VAYILKPLVFFFLKIAASVVRFFGANLTPQASHISTEEIRTLIDIGEEEGVLAKEEREMISSVIEFRETLVSSVMTPRVDIVSVPDDSTVRDVLEIMVREGHSRLPVYRDGMDDIVGLVDSRQILTRIAEGEKNLLVRQIMRTVFFVPEVMKVSVLLKEFKRRKLHLAVVMDEYGGTAGLVTIDDLLEEIVGEIADEHGVEEADFQKIDENTCRMEAQMSIDKANEVLNLNIEEDGAAETVGGFVSHHLGRIPAVGEQFRYQNLLFTVEQADNRSVSLLLVQKLAPRPASDTAKN